MTGNLIKWERSPKDAAQIKKLAKRAVSLFAQCGIEVDREDIEMDITACHCNAYYLNLDGLLKVDDSIFAHDVFGIHYGISHTTGRIKGPFRPLSAMWRIK